LAVAGLAVAFFYLSARLVAQAPWSYDEYFHLGMARELWRHFPLRSFPWTPFSEMSARFADAVPLFHLALMPFSGLSIERAALAGVALCQVFVLTSLGVVLWRLRVERAWAYMLGMATLGSLFAMRFDMCRPHLLLIGFSVLFVGLLVTGARPWVLALVAGLFGLAHAGGWIAIFYAAVWGVAGFLVPAASSLAGTARARRAVANPPPNSAAAAAPPGTPAANEAAASRRAAGRRVLWQPAVWAAAGWIVGQLIHPNVPVNLHLLVLVNLVVPFQASPAGNAALQSQIGEELTRLSPGILAEQWPLFLSALVVAVSLLRDRRLRSRATLATALISVSFLVVGAALLQRFLELGAPLALVSLAVLAAERRRLGLGGLAGGWTAWIAAGAILAGSLWTATTVRYYGFGNVSAPQEMARWMAEHGQAGERVFTAQWADSAPLFYYAPQVQSLVALDPTMFWVKDPHLFQEYVDIVQGKRPDAAALVRHHFGARWVTLWQVPVYERFAEYLVATPGVRLVYKDAHYVIADLGGVR
jgi:hypothetical protein